MTKEEKAIREFCGHHANWWPSITQVQEMLALAQPEQEPLTENGMYRLGYHNGYGFGEAYGKAISPQRTWVGLTDEDIWEAYMESTVELDCSTDELYALSRTVEAKLKDKNTRGQE